MEASQHEEPQEAHEPHDPGLRMPWSWSDRPLPRMVVRPVQQFLHTEASGGILLLAAAAVALIWANVSGGSYESVFHTEIRLGVGSWAITEDLRHWINDAAMALFFFVVGLEIKRELVSGELRDPRVAALPTAAAVGGMVVPALLYFMVNSSGDGSRGWGIPMATDIAFAVGVLALAGRGLPSKLKLFLLTLAIVDDIGAILVIAIFYTESLSFGALGIAVGLLGVMVVLRRLQVRWGGVYAMLGIAVWVAVFESGVHATIAGVALAFVTPAVAFQRPKAVSHEARRVADQTSDDPSGVDADAPQWLHLAGLSREAVSPLARLMHSMHPWTSFVIVPVFALANAGVSLRGSDLGGRTSSRVLLGVILGLVVGKILGITLGAAVAIKLRLARLPAGIGWGHVTGAAALGGIGFTVSLFIGGLAFGDGEVLDAAKIGVLAASALSGLIGTVLLTRIRRRAS